MLANTSMVSRGQCTAIHWAVTETTAAPDASERADCAGSKSLRCAGAAADIHRMRMSTAGVSDRRTGWLMDFMHDASSNG